MKRQQPLWPARNRRSSFYCSSSSQLYLLPSQGKTTNLHAIFRAEEQQRALSRATRHKRTRTVAAPRANAWTINIAGMRISTSCIEALGEWSVPLDFVFPERHLVSHNRCHSCGHPCLLRSLHHTLSDARARLGLEWCCHADTHLATAAPILPGTVPNVPKTAEETIQTIRSL